jgi:large subunit ribosomal protein L18
MKKTKKKLYLQQKKRSLKRIIGTKEKPRLSVFRSHKHIYAQLIDDNTKQTLVFCSTLEKSVKEKTSTFATQAASFLVGEFLAKKALIKNIQTVVFDRGKKPYHGRIKSLADGAREQGLLF